MHGYTPKLNCHCPVVVYRPMESRHSFKAPGRAERNGISLAEFFRLFPDDLAAEAWASSIGGCKLRAV